MPRAAAAGLVAITRYLPHLLLPHTHTVFVAALPLCVRLFQFYTLHVCNCCYTRHGYAHACSLLHLVAVAAVLPTRHGSTVPLHHAYVAMHFTVPDDWFAVCFAHGLRLLRTGVLRYRAVAAFWTRCYTGLVFCGLPAYVCYIYRCDYVPPLPILVRSRVTAFYGCCCGCYLFGCSVHLLRFAFVCTPHTLPFYRTFTGWLVCSCPSFCPHFTVYLLLHFTTTTTHITYLLRFTFCYYGCLFRLLPTFPLHFTLPHPHATQLPLRFTLRWVRATRTPRYILPSPRLRLLHYLTTCIARSVPVTFTPHHVLVVRYTLLHTRLHFTHILRGSFYTVLRYVRLVRSPHTVCYRTLPRLLRAVYGSPHTVARLPLRLHTFGYTRLPFAGSGSRTPTFWFVTYTLKTRGRYYTRAGLPRVGYSSVYLTTPAATFAVWRCGIRTTFTLPLPLHTRTTFFLVRTHFVYLCVRWFSLPLLRFLLHIYT